MLSMASNAFPTTLQRVTPRHRVDYDAVAPVPVLQGTSPSTPFSLLDVNRGRYLVASTIYLSILTGLHLSEVFVFLPFDLKLLRHSSWGQGPIWASRTAYFLGRWMCLVCLFTALTQPFFQVSSCLASSIVMAVAFVLAIMCAQALLSLHLLALQQSLRFGRLLSLSTWLFVIAVTVAASLVGSGFCQDNTNVYDRPYCLPASAMSAQTRLVVVLSGLLLMSHAFNTIATIYVLRSRVHTAAMGEGAYSLFRMVIKQTTIGGLLIMVLAGAQIGFAIAGKAFLFHNIGTWTQMALLSHLAALRTRRIDEVPQAEATDTLDGRDTGGTSRSPAIKSVSLLPTSPVSPLQPSMAGETLTVSPTHSPRPVYVRRSTGRRFRLPQHWTRSENASIPQALLMENFERTPVPDDTFTNPCLTRQEASDGTQEKTHRVPRKPVGSKPPRSALTQHEVSSRLSEQSIDASSLAFVDAVSSLPLIPRLDSSLSHFTQQDISPVLFTASNSQQESTRSSSDLGLLSQRPRLATLDASTRVANLCSAPASSEQLGVNSSSDESMSPSFTALPRPKPVKSARRRPTSDLLAAEGFEELRAHGSHKPVTRQANTESREQLQSVRCTSAESLPNVAFAVTNDARPGGDGMSGVDIPYSRRSSSTTSLSPPPWHHRRQMPRQELQSSSLRRGQEGRRMTRRGRGRSEDMDSSRSRIEAVDSGSGDSTDTRSSSAEMPTSDIMHGRSFK